jgi:drug/metabolite transporter (DMT)-like permease
MDLLFGVFFGLITAFCFGTADFLSKSVVRKLGYYKALLFYQIFGWVPVFLYVLFFLKILILSVELMGLVLITALFNIGGFIFFFKALEKGQVSIVSPIISSWGAITTLLALIILHETLTPTQLTMVVLIFIGVALTSLEYGGLKRIKQNISLGVPEALIGVVIFGMAFFLSKFLVNDLGGILTLFYVRLTGFLYLLFSSPLKGIEFSLPKRKILFTLVVMGLLDSFGYFSYYTGIDRGLVSIVAPVAGLTSLFAVILARVFYKEKLVLNQKIGIALAITGLVGLSL